MDNFENRVAVITGGASGIGLAIAQELGSAGAQIVLADVEADALDAAVRHLDASGTAVLGVQTDVSREDDIVRLADRTISEFGGVHLLFNNAGVDAGGWFKDIPVSAWEWVMDVNFYGALHGCRVFLPLLSQEPEAHIVNTASVAAFATGAPMMTPYCVSKSALLALTECLEIELRAQGSSVGVSLLVPGPTRTRMPHSARNLPPVLSSLSTPEKEEASIRAMEYLEHHGLEPAEAAKLTLEAIKNDRFFVLTHPSLVTEAMTKRFDWMTDNVAPAPRSL